MGEGGDGFLTYVLTTSGQNLVMRVEAKCHMEEKQHGGFYENATLTCRS